jgi:hypothetical protein
MKDTAFCLVKSMVVCQDCGDSLNEAVYKSLMYFIGENRMKSSMLSYIEVSKMIDRAQTFCIIHVVDVHRVNWCGDIIPGPRS